MNVYEEAHNLATAIKESGEYKEFDQARKSIDQDPQLKEMVKQMESIQMEMQLSQARGEQINPQLMSQLQSISAMLMTKPEAAGYIQSMTRFSVMMKDVYDILIDAIGVNMPGM